MRGKGREGEVGGEEEVSRWEGKERGRLSEGGGGKGIRMTR